MQQQYSNTQFPCKATSGLNNGGCAELVALNWCMGWGVSKWGAQVASVVLACEERFSQQLENADELTNFALSYILSAIDIANTSR